MSNAYASEVLQGAPAYYGKFKGFVRDVNDPQKAGRVRVFCPAVMGPLDSTETWLDWAPVDAGGFGGTVGQDFGGSVVPAVGSPVWVEFERGDAEFPVVVGTWTQFGAGSPSLPKLARGEADSSTASEARTSEGVTVSAIPSGTPEYPFNRIFKTKAGHVLEVDETPGARRIRIRHPSGTVEEIDNSGNLVKHVVSDFLMWVGSALKMTAVGDAVIAAGALVRLGSGTAARKVLYADATISTFNGHTHPVTGTAGPYPISGNTVSPTGQMSDASHAVPKVRVP